MIYNVQEEDLQTALQVLCNLLVEDLLFFQNYEMQLNNFLEAEGYGFVDIEACSTDVLQHLCANDDYDFVMMDLNQILQMALYYHQTTV